MDKCAFIIGNGKSRKDFPLPSLKGKGKIFGCNYLHEDFTPDYIVAVDKEVIKDLYSSDFPQHKILIGESHELSGSGLSSNAGMCAMHEAIKKGSNQLFCLGFDFLLKSKEESISNIYNERYANRAVYEDNVNRVKYLSWFADKFSNVQFTFIFEKAPCEIHNIPSPNVNGMFYDQFIEYLKELNNGS